MKREMRRMTVREIKDTFGRFFAILAIIALGVGLFAGLKMTKPDMVRTIQDYYEKNNFYDLHLLSTLGFGDEDVEAYEELDGVAAAEGSYSMDVLFAGIGDNEKALKTMTIPNKINRPELSEGRFPESKNECVVDSKMGEVQVGDVICVSDTNVDTTINVINEKQFTVVGKVTSPLYINFERGTTTIGTGKLTGFVYVMPEAVDTDYYSDVYVTFDKAFDLYSSEYDDYIEERTEKFEELSQERMKLRYKDFLITAGMPESMAEDKANEPNEDVNCYVLGRNTNIGYACFESDSGIVSGVAKVFPVFFILVAVLVCMTTMNRMVEDQRSMIGMLKALGYGENAIMGKYMIYSGTAAVAGCLVGYFGGTILFPEVIWFAYHLMYIDIDLVRVHNLTLIALVFVVSLACTVGTTWISCRAFLLETAAQLMRPKAPKPGKRVFLEHIGFIWKRMKFLAKVSARNIFRYKKRLFMMVIGISGCTALLLTGFGIKDSIMGFADDQFDNIQIADGTATLANVGADITETFDTYTKNYDMVHEQSVELVNDDSVKSANLVVLEHPENTGLYMDFKDKTGAAIPIPEKGEAVINNALADLYDIEAGDVIVLRDSDMREMKVAVSGVFVNHVYNYVFMTPETYEEGMGKAPEYKSVYFTLKEDSDSHEVSARLMESSQVTSVTINSDVKERVSNMMSSLNYIVLVIILAAGALAFIVIYNLTNINITERIREIATIKVLGFTGQETSSYVFRENRVLTLMGVILGLGLGVLLHAFVMAQIKVDMIYFDVVVRPVSYIFSAALTFAFGAFVNLIMSFRIEKINMAESLKSIE